VKIAIDLTATLPQPAGVDRHLSCMVSSLAAIDRENEYALFVNVEDRARFRDEPLPPNFHVRALSVRPRVGRLLFQQILQPAALRWLGADVLHSPAFIMPAIRGRQRHVLTVHDMTSFFLPECHPPVRRGPLYERFVTTSIRRADLVTVPSSAVREDILRLVDGVDGGRLRVIRSGVTDEFRPRDAAEVRPVLERLGIAWPYVLFVGTIDPRKNVRRLIDAFRDLVAGGGVAEHLVIAGQQGWSTGGALEAATVDGIRGRVHFTGWVPESDLASLYAGASLFAYPSLAEGFGFPPLEAMACGIPVVASLTSSLRDNLSGAAELVPPVDVGALTAALGRLLRDDRLRAERRAAGLARAAAFRWEAFARRTLDCYRELADGGAARPA
jgi:alpha-1,3-rhamnosyl/mannosyltransferase